MGNNAVHGEKKNMTRRRVSQGEGATNQRKKNCSWLSMKLVGFEYTYSICVFLCALLPCASLCAARSCCDMSRAALLGGLIEFVTQGAFLCPVCLCVCVFFHLV